VKDVKFSRGDPLYRQRCVGRGVSMLLAASPSGTLFSNQFIVWTPCGASEDSPANSTPMALRSRSMPFLWSECGQINKHLIELAIDAECATGLDSSST